MDTIKNEPMDWFLDGQRDCRDGKPHQPGKPEAYDSGYSFQYQLEQNQGASNGYICRH